MKLFLSLLTVTVVTLMPLSSLLADDSALKKPTTLPLTSSSGAPLIPIFLDRDSLKITTVLPPPPGNPPSEESHAPQQFLTQEEDLYFQECAMATAGEAEKNHAMSIIYDSVFDYAEIFGPHFSAAQFPLTKAFFDKIRNDVIVACTAAKNTFQRPRPASWTKMTPEDKEIGYTYPSGHTTRAFVIAELLCSVFPQSQKALLQEAERISWSRVIIGRHYPSEVFAGKLYADYLVTKFYENPAFQKEWSAVQEELIENAALLVTKE